MNKLMTLYYTHYNHLRFFQFCLFLANEYKNLKNKDMFYATNEEIEQFAAEYCEMSNMKARDVSTNVLFDFGAVLCYNKFVSEREEKERR